MMIFLPLHAQVVNADRVGQAWETDMSKSSVPLHEFRALLRRDGIPPIDKPVYMSREEGLETYFSHEPVISIEAEGEALAFPLNILTYHEIVNTEVGGVPISATYCPLCNAAIVFDRRLTFEGKEYLLDFGVSGMLRKSDLVMWDRQTESWWQQFTGEALVGELQGAQLTFLSAQIITVASFFERYPEGKILSNELGFERQKLNYGSNVYEKYDSLGSNPRLFKGKVDDRLPAMERVVDIRIKNKYKIYPLRQAAKQKVIHDEFEGKRVVLFYLPGMRSVLDTKDIREGRKIGTVTVFEGEIAGKSLTFFRKKATFIDKETGSVWDITGRCLEGIHKGKQLTPLPHGNHFAFSWFAFHPDTDIYKKR